MARARAAVENFAKENMIVKVKRLDGERKASGGFQKNVKERLE